MAYIKVWCEYDFNGQFGSNNEEVFELADDTPRDVAESIVLEYLCSRTGCSQDDLEDLFGFERISISTLGE